MADPSKYTRDYSFTDYQASNPSAPLPGLQVDAELEDVEASIGEIVDAIKDVRRSDGALKNGIVTVDSLDATVAAGVGSGALASAAAAAASADAASDSAVASAASATAAGISETAASGYASDALTYRNAASGFADDSAAAANLAQTARDYANQWATEAEDTLVDDGVNTPGYSAYHWAQVALDAAAGSIADGSVTTPKLADGALSADATGRAKMADGFLSADTAGRAKVADGFVNTTKLASGALSADATGRGKMADGFLTLAKLDAGAYASQAEAEAGTENTKLLTPLRAWQAVTAYNRWKTIADQEFGGVAQFIRTNLGDFRTLRFEGDFRATTVAQDLLMRLSVDNGATWLAGTNYFFSQISYDTFNFAGSNTTGSAMYLVGTGSAEEGGAGAEFQHKLGNFNKSLTKTMTGSQTLVTATPANAISLMGNRAYGAPLQNPCNALQIFPGAGSALNGYIHIEGLPG